MVLTSVSALSRLESRLAPSTLSSRISSFLDVSAGVSCEKALAIGRVSLLHHVLTREFASATTEPLALHRWVWMALKDTLASKNGPSLELVQCLVTYIHPARPLGDAILWAIEAGRDLATVQWLYQQATSSKSKKDPSAKPLDGDLLLRAAVVSCNLEIIQFLLEKRQQDVVVPPAPGTTSSSSRKPLHTLSSVNKKLLRPSFDIGASPKSAAFLKEMTPQKWQVVDLVIDTTGLLLHRSLPLLAASQGRLSTIQKMQKHTNALFDITTANAAASHGQFETVTFLGVAPDARAIDDAVLLGKLEVIMFLYETYNLQATSVGVLRAADKGHTNVLDWLFGTFPAKDFWKDVTGLVKPALLAAAAAGRLSTVQWIHEKLIQPLLLLDQDLDLDLVDPETVYVAIRFGYLPVVQYLHAHNLIQWDDRWESRNAVYYGDLQTILWLNENGLMRDPDNELQNAVYGGRLDCIQWVLANRPRGTNLFALEAAAMSGNLDVIQLLIEKGFSGSFRAMVYAASKGFLEIVQILFQNRREDGCSQAALHGACLGGYLEIIQFFTEKNFGTCTTTAMDSAAGKNFLEIVQYLHKNRTEGCTVFAMDSAATNGNLEIVQFLHANRSEGCTSAALEGAASNGHLEMVQFLMDKYPQLDGVRAIRCARAKGEVEIAQWIEQHLGGAVAPMAPIAPMACCQSSDAMAPPTPLVAQVI